MQHLEVSGVPVLYIGRTVPKGYALILCLEMLKIVLDRKVLLCLLSTGRACNFSLLFSLLFCHYLYNVFY